MAVKVKMRPAGRRLYSPSLSNNLAATLLTAVSTLPTVAAERQSRAHPAPWSEEKAMGYDGKRLTQYSLPTADEVEPQAQENRRELAGNMVPDFDELNYRRKLSELFGVSPDEIVLNISATVVLKDAEGGAQGAVNKASAFFNISVASIGDMTTGCETVEENRTYFNASEFFAGAGLAADNVYVQDNSVAIYLSVVFGPIAAFMIGCLWWRNRRKLRRLRAKFVRELEVERERAKIAAVAVLHKGEANTKQVLHRTKSKANP